MTDADPRCQECGSDLVMPTLLEHGEQECWACGAVWVATR